VSPARKRWVLGGGALAFGAIVLAAVLLLSGGSTPEAASTSSAKPSPPVESATEIATKYLKSFSDNYVGGAAVVTDDTNAATTALTGLRASLKGAKVVARLTQVAPAAAGATKTTATFSVSWTFSAGQVWSYDNTLELVLSNQKWLVHWTPALLNPKLAAGERLALGTVSVHPTVVDRDGKPLVTSAFQPVDGNPAPLLQSSLTTVAQEHGTSDTSFSIVRADSAGKPLETLFGQDGAETKPLTSSLSLKTQTAAQSAVDKAKGSAMLVAISASTGDILAVAQNAAAGGAPKALSGLYAPGSTFKIVTATAAMAQSGVAADTVLECPGSAQIGQRTISNANFAKPPIPLHSAFAFSCNTTFAKLASDLGPNGLKQAADQFGLNADFDIPGISTETGKVEADGSETEQVEDGIGQGKVQVSPFGAALMAATVAAGKAVTPKLWHGIDTKVTTKYSAPPGNVITSLRSMMREVVTGGTATALKGSGNVAGKTGTAQTSDSDPSKANGWFVGYRGDVAFAVLLEGSDSSAPALPVAAGFLAAL
jgi:beta-lactamase class D